MKRSLILSLMLAAGFAALGLRDHARLAALEKIGNSPAAGTAGETTHGKSRRPRRTRGGEVEALLADLRSFLKSPDAAGIEEDAIELRFRSLKPGQLEELARRFLETAGIPAEVRSQFLAEVIGQLAGEDPAAALDLYATHFAEIEEVDLDISNIDLAVARRAKDDPEAALEWYLKNEAEHRDYFKDSTLIALFKGTAACDPGLAFGLFARLKDAGFTNSLASGPDDPFAENSFVKEVVRMATTGGERSANLAALRKLAPVRKLAPGTPVEAQMAAQGIGELAAGLDGESFDDAVKWVSAANLWPVELPAFAANLPADPRWIRWGSENLLPFDFHELLRRQILLWSQRDVTAVGKWLEAQTDENIKSTAASTYALSLTDERPSEALRWARTLPAGNDREETFEHLENSFPPDSAEAKEVRAEVNR